MMTKINILSTSDWHIGHPRVPSLDIINELYRYMLPKLKQTDLLVIAGDVTDRELSFGDVSTKLLVHFFLDLYSITSDLGIPILLLRGTVSHDRNHLQTLVSLHKKGHYENTLYYHESLAIDHIKEHDLKVGFIPDNLPYKSSKDVMTVLKKMMEDRDWDSLDYVITHGYFSHLVPEHINIGDHVYKEEEFTFVKKYILSGHVHIPSQYGKVLMNGSFSRLNHGEEEPKGFLYLEDYGKDVKINFIENKEATKFITLDLPNASEDQIIKNIKSLINDDDEIIHLRLKHKDPVLRISIREFIKNNYKNIRYTHVSTIKNKRVKDKDDNLHESHLFNPTEETLTDLILDFLKDDHHRLTKTRIDELLKV